MRVNISPNFATLSCNLGMFLHVYCPKNLFMLSKHLSQFLVVLQTRLPSVQFYEFLSVNIKLEIYMKSLFTGLKYD